MRALFVYLVFAVSDPLCFLIFSAHVYTGFLLMSVYDCIWSLFESMPDSVGRTCCFLYQNKNWSCAACNSFPITDDWKLEISAVSYCFCQGMSAYCQEKEECLKNTSPGQRGPLFARQESQYLWDDLTVIIHNTVSPIWHSSAVFFVYKQGCLHS